MESSDDEAEIGNKDEEFLKRVVQTQWKETVEEFELEEGTATGNIEHDPDETIAGQHC